MHRTGSDRDHYASAAMALAADPLTITPRPNVVERVVAMYARWRSELDPRYSADLSG